MRITRANLLVVIMIFKSLIPGPVAGWFCHCESNTNYAWSNQRPQLKVASSGTTASSSRVVGTSTVPINAAQLLERASRIIVSWFAE